MRPVGFTLAFALLAALAVHAQPPGVPAPPPAPLTPAQLEVLLDAHLDAWEKRMSDSKNFHAKFALTRVANNAFKKKRDYSGQVLCKKPNLARLNIASATDKDDFDAYICDGKSIFEYHYKDKKVTEIPLGPGGGDNLMLDFLGGMKKKDVKKRFQISLFNPEDKTYVYLDIKPINAKDKQDFEHVRFALYGPNVPAGYVSYLPSEVWLMHPNGDTETWKFAEQKIDLKEIGVQHFQYEPPKEKGWEFQKAPVAPPPPGFGMPPKLPGGTGLPPGAGAVKP